MATAWQCSWRTPLAVGAVATPMLQRRASQQQDHHRCCAATVDQAGTPLLDAVLERGERRGEVPFHVPGHKRGSGAPPGLRRLLGSAGLHHDLTELQGG